MRYIILAITILSVIVLSGCHGDGVSSTDSFNDCFSITSSDPCFDQEAVGDTALVDGKSPEEVITEQEDEQGFIRRLNVKEIIRTFGYSIFLPPLDPLCRWDESVIVINS